MAPVIWPCQSPGCTKTVPVEDEPHLAIQLLRLHGVQVHGLPNMDRSPKVTSTKEGKHDNPVLAATSTQRRARGMEEQTSSTTVDTLDTTPALAISSDEDTSHSVQSAAKGVHTRQTLHPGLSTTALSPKDSSSSKERGAKRTKKVEVAPDSMETEDTSSKETLLNFGRLLNLYQSSPTPPLLPCPWSTCPYVTEAVEMKDGKPVGAEPDIAIQLLSLHVAYAHSETDLEFLSFLLLEKMLCALPRPTLTRPTSTHTAPSNQPGQQEGARVKVEKQSKPVIIKSSGLSVEKEGSAGISLRCHQCEFVTEKLKPSKANQRLSSHQNSHHAKPAPLPSPGQGDNIQNVPPLSPSQEGAKTAPPRSPCQEETPNKHETLSTLPPSAPFLGKTHCEPVSTSESQENPSQTLPPSLRAQQ